MSVSNQAQVGAELFGLWQDFQSQCRAMVNPELIRDSNQAVLDQIAEQAADPEMQDKPISVDGVAQRIDLSKYERKPDPGIERRKLMGALEAVERQLPQSGLKKAKQKELAGYTQALLTGLSRGSSELVEVGQMTAWILKDLGYQGHGL